VKAGDTAAAAAIAERMQPVGVLSLQNGLTGELLRAHCRAALVDQGITTEGAYRERTAAGERVQPSGAGETLLPPGFEAVAEMLVRVGLRARVEPDIARARLAKLLVNVAINPLAAIHRVPNGALLEPPHRALLDTLVREALPAELHETAYVLCAEVAASDLEVRDEEVRFIDKLAEKLGLDDLVCAALQRAARARHMRA